MEESPTIRSLAKIAGVSNATVSLALRDNPRIRPDVRKRIREIAQEQGYTANPIVAALLSQLRSKKKLTYKSTLGVVALGSQFAAIRQIKTFQEWIVGCEDRASSLGYALDFFSLGDGGITPGRLVKIVHARNIRGLLVLGSNLEELQHPECESLWQYAASIVIGMQPAHPKLCFTSNEQFSATQQAVREVVRLGYKRPALCLNGEIDARVNGRFRGGFLVAQQQLAEKDCLPILDFKPDAQRSFAAWVKRHRPDVLLTLHHEILPWLEGMGMKVPDDVGFVHLDTTTGSKWAGICQNNEDVGRAAVDLVIGQLHRNEFGLPPFQKGMFVTGSWISGPTVRTIVRAEKKHAKA